DLGGSAHILIRLTPIVEELRLEQFGLTYLELDPLFFAPFPDGDALFFYRNTGRTADELDRRFPGEGEAYTRLLGDWRQFVRMVKDLFLTIPCLFDLGRKIALGGEPRLTQKDALRAILRPYGKIVDAYVREEKVKATH